MKWLSCVACMVLALATTTLGAHFKVPPLTGPVNDYAGVLSSAEVKNLSQTLLAREQQTGNQIVVLIVKSLEGQTVETYAVKVFESWKLGSKKLDNGALLLLATEDHKGRIEVGYGLESQLTDAVSDDILRNHMVPLLKQQKFYDAVVAGTTQMSNVVSGSFIASAGPAGTSQVTFSGTKILATVLFVVLAIICSLIGSGLAGVGGFVGGIGSFCIAAGLITTWPFALLFGIVGAVVGTILTVAGPDGVANFVSSGSSGSSGGGSFGGGGSSYSGGGGSSGGGGASASW